jgi:hypothetical protein
MIRGILFFGALIAWLTLLTSMLVILVCAFAAARNRLPSAPRHWIVALNKFSAIWFPERLSAKGLVYRARWIRFCWAFFGSAAAFIICAGLLALLANHN